MVVNRKGRSKGDGFDIPMTGDAVEISRSVRGGRPTRVAAAQRDERLLKVAAMMFMERGFDATSMDAVAETAGVGKATLYTRYRDKEALFADVFLQQINRVLAPFDLATLQTSSVEDIEETLYRVGCQLLARSLAPEVVSINRILISQALRFPELARLAHQEGWSRSLEMVGRILSGFAAGGVIRIADPELAADMFLCLVVGRTTRTATFNLPLPDKTALEQRVRFAVKVFLDGVRVSPMSARSARSNVQPRPPWNKQEP